VLHDDRALLAHCVEYRPEVRKERCRLFVADRERHGDLGPVRAFEYEKHSLGADELGRFLDQEFMQLGCRAKLVQPQARVDQPLERLAQASLPAKVLEDLLGRDAAFARVPQAQGDDFAMNPNVAEIAAPDALVADPLNPLLQKPIRDLERVARFGGAPVRRQCLAVREPDVARGMERCQGHQVHRAMKAHAPRTRGERRACISRRQASLGKPGQRDDLADLILSPPPVLVGFAEPPHRLARIALAHRELAKKMRDGRGDRRHRATLRKRFELGEERARRLGVAHQELEPGLVRELVSEGGCRPGLSIDLRRPAAHAPRTRVQAEVPVHEPDIRRRHALPFDVACGCERRPRLVEKAQGKREIGLVERQSVQCVSGAVEIAGPPREREGLSRRGSTLFTLAAPALRRGEGPERAAFSDLIAQGAVKLDGGDRVAFCVGRLRAPAELRLRKAKKAEREKGLAPGFAGRFERHLGSPLRVPEFAGAHPYHRLAIECEAKLRGSPPLLRNFEHIGGVGCRAPDVSLRDEALAAQVENLDPSKRRQARMLERLARALDRLGVASRPRQVPHLCYSRLGGLLSRHRGSLGATGP
jgi:hypothetical protein